MKRFLKILLWSVLTLVLLLGILMGGFVYKVKNGFPVSYETEAPEIEFPLDQPAVLLFSKSTGFRHGESIDAGKKVFTKIAKNNNWFLYSTEEGGVFNTEQLAKFDVVIFNNSTGRVLNDTQQKVLEKFVNNGGSLIGIHGAGDDSHHWEWYEQNLLGTKFSHHSLNPQLQETTVTVHDQIGNQLTHSLPTTWKHEDEWYVFFDNPKEKGFNILLTIDGDEINTNGNMLWMKDKDFGMGKEHPVAWYRNTGKGKTFYTSIGHDANAWEEESFLNMLVNAVNWSAK